MSTAMAEHRYRKALEAGTHLVAATDTAPTAGVVITAGTHFFVLVYGDDAIPRLTRSGTFRSVDRSHLPIQTSLHSRWLATVDWDDGTRGQHPIDIVGLGQVPKPQTFAIAVTSLDDAQYQDDRPPKQKEGFPLGARPRSCSVLQPSGQCNDWPSCVAP